MNRAIPKTRRLELRSIGGLRCALTPRGAALADLVGDHNDQRLDTIIRLLAGLGPVLDAPAAAV